MFCWMSVFLRGRKKLEEEASQGLKIGIGLTNESIIRRNNEERNFSTSSNLFFFVRSSVKFLDRGKRAPQQICTYKYVYMYIYNMYIHMYDMYVCMYVCTYKKSLRLTYVHQFVPMARQFNFLII
jgi:hypothetical protein